MAEGIGKRGKKKTSFEVRVFVRRDAKGRPVMHRKLLGSLAEAKAYRAQALIDRRLNRLSEPSGETVGDYLHRWLKIASTQRLRPGTADLYADYVRKYVPPIAKVRLDRLGPFAVQSFYSDLMETGLSGATVRRVHGMLSSALKQAVRWGVLPQNPCSLVDLPKAQRREMRALSPEEAAGFLSAAKADRYAALWALLLATGMRPGEAFSLRWSDVDLKACAATVRRSLTWRRGGKWVFTEPKTAKSGRSIPFPAELGPMLEAHRAKQEAERASAGATWENLGLVFSTDRGTPLERRNLIHRHFRHVREAAGLPDDFRLYDLRHSCATLLLAEGVHPKVVSERLGHSKIVLTLDTYSHVLPTMQDQATQALGRLLFG